MKKTFPLTAKGKHPDRVLDSIKHDLGKHIKRERQKGLPLGVDFWDFECLVGVTETTAQPVHFAALKTKIDEIAASGAATVFVQMTTTRGVRKFEPRQDASLDS